MNSIRIKFIVLLFALSALGFASDDCSSFLYQAVLKVDKTHPSKIQMGTVFNLTLKNQNEPVEVILLGKLVAQDGKVMDYSFYDPVANKIHLIPENTIELSTSANTKLTHDDFRSIVKSENQEGGTCAAYSLYNCMRQMHYDGYQGTEKKLAAKLETESTRQRLLVKAINKIYVEETSSFEGAVQQFAVDFGFKLNVVSDNLISRKFHKAVVEALGEGYPVLFRFDVTPKMIDMPYDVINHPKLEASAKRLWLPRASGESHSGGHAIVALGMIQDSKGETWILVSDPNWQAPRLWNIKEFEKSRSASMKAFIFRE